MNSQPTQPQCQGADKCNIHCLMFHDECRTCGWISEYVPEGEPYDEISIGLNEFAPSTVRNLNKHL